MPGPAMAIPTSANSPTPDHAKETMLADRRAGTRRIFSVNVASIIRSVHAIWSFMQKKHKHTSGAARRHFFHAMTEYAAVPTMAVKMTHGVRWYPWTLMVSLMRAYRGLRPQAVDPMAWYTVFQEAPTRRRM